MGHSAPATEFMPPERLTLWVCPDCLSVSKHSPGQKGHLCGCSGWKGRNGTAAVQCVYGLVMHRTDTHAG